MNERPERIGPYRIVEELGRGGMGQVYRGEHIETGAPAAVKTVRAVRRHGMSGIRREIRALARIRHPGVVRILDEGVQAGLPWYAMELLEGPTLRQAVRQLGAGATEPTKIVEPAAGSLDSTEIDAPGSAGSGPEPREAAWWTAALGASTQGSSAADSVLARSGKERARASVPATPARASRGASRPLAAGGALTAVLTLVRRLCSPLAFLHGEGIVHRDLKPENILVTGARQWAAGGSEAQQASPPPARCLLPPAIPVLVDFGLASQWRLGGLGDPLPDATGEDSASREALEIAGSVVGTAQYMAPEQVCGELVDARADLYALGCILYELLTGRPPFTGRSRSELLSRHLLSDPRRPSELVEGVPAELDELVLRLLAKPRRERIGHAADVAEALARLGAEDGGLEAEAPKPRAYLYRPGLAGRAAALDQLEAQLSRLGSGSGALVLVGGESGVGKTRLVLEFAREDRRSGTGVLVGECLPLSLEEQAPGAAGGGAPLQGLRRALRAIADRCREQGREETERLLGQRGKLLALFEPALAGLPGQEAHPEPVKLPPEAARLRLYRGLAGTLAALAQGRPQLLVLDDLQWADELTLGLLQHLVRTGWFATTPLLLVGTYRSDEVGPTRASPGLRWLLESPEVVRIALGRLDARSVGAMVRDMLAVAAAPEAFVQFLIRQSEGNPFFVAEYLRMAVAEGLLVQGQWGRWHVAAEGAGQAAEAVYRGLPLPGSLRALVARRLGGLSAEARRLVQAAAVLGREVDADMAAEVAGLAEAEALEPAAEILAGQVMDESADGRLRFLHDKLREAAYQALAPEELAELHRAAAVAGERRWEREPEEHLAELGHHWERAGEIRRARDMYLQGARVARSRHALGEARRLYEAYLAMVPEPDAESVAARNELAHDVFRLQGQPTEAISVHRQALAEARSLGDRGAEAETLRMLGSSHQDIGRLDDADGFYRQALDVHRERGDRKNEAATLGGRAVVHLRQGRSGEAMRLFEQALDRFREAGDRKGEASILVNLACTYLEHEGAPEPQALFERALSLFRQLGNRQNEAITLANLAVWHSACGRFLEAQALDEQALAIFREVGDRKHEGRLLGNLGAMKVNLGHLEEALADSERALAIHQEIGERGFEGLDLGGVGLALHLLRRDPARARSVLEQSVAVLREVGIRKDEAFVLANLGHVCSEQGDAEAAMAAYNRSVAICRETGAWTHEVQGLCLIAQHRRRTGDLGEAETRVGEAESRLGKAKSVLGSEGGPHALMLSLCERAHLELARGKSASALLERVRHMVTQSQAGPESLWGQAFGRLRRAQEAFERGEPLLRGERIEDLPPGLRRWLVETGRLEAAG
jgi:serine/threonine protein kinase/tetratricopeptide (TPR) repeat protein